jgi:hypothetical protein
MIRVASTVLLVIFVLTFSVGRESRPPQAVERVRPCALHPVNGRVCLSEGALRGLLLKLVPPEQPRGANGNEEVVLHVLIPRTGGKPAKISVVSGDPVFTRSAIRAVRDWVFMAYVYKGQDVGIEGDLHIKFDATK